MNALFFVGVSILLVYLVFVMVRVGVPPSLSDSYYSLKKQGFLFQLTLIILCFTFTPILLELTEGQWWQFTAFFAVAPIGFVAVAPQFKMERSVERKVHFGAAIISGVISFIWVSLTAIYINSITWWSILIAVGVALMAWLINRRKNLTFWMEASCFLWTIIALIQLLYFNQ